MVLSLVLLIYLTLYLDRSLSRSKSESSRTSKIGKNKKTEHITSLNRRQTIHLASCLESCELNYMHIWPIAVSIHLCQDWFLCGISKPWLCYKPFLCNGYFFFFLLNNFRLYNAISTIKVTMENTSNRILAQILQVCFSHWGAFYLGNQVWRYLALMRGSGRINKSPNMPWSSCSPLK